MDGLGLLALVMKIRMEDNVVNETARYQELDAKKQAIEKKISQERARIVRAKNQDLDKIKREANRLIFLIGSAVLKDSGSKNDGQQNEPDFKITKENIKELLGRHTELEADRNFLNKRKWLNNDGVD